MKIAVWCDGTWCDVDDLAEYSFMSDDYHIAEVPDGVEPAELAAYTCAEHDAYLDDLCRHVGA